MEILNIVLIGVLSFLGLPAGFLLARIAEEELKAGKVYFRIMQSIIFALALLIAAYYIIPNLGTFAVIALVVIYISIKLKPVAITHYIAFVLLFILGLRNVNLFIIMNSLIFLYGFPTGALMVQRGFVNYMKEEIENPISTGYLSRIKQTLRYILWVLMLEIISVPTFFMGKKRTAIYHLKYVCPICPSGRRKHRGVNGKSTCWWEYNWRKGNYRIPKHFGMINWIRQYIRIGTNLKRFKDFK